MAKKLSFSIALNLLTENFKKGTGTVKNSLRSIQMQVLAFATALGVGGLGLSGLLTRFKDVARETSRVITALKNVSNGTKGLADNLRFVNDLAKKYGLEVNALTGNFAKFTASATQANMPMEQQKKVFESLSRASTAFGLSAEDTNGVFLALSQMMGKGKISSEELRKQMGERIPIAMQAMAKAAGVSMAGLEKLLKQGKLLSSEIIPKFADALNGMIPNVDTDNLETSLNRLSNTFNNIVHSSGFQNKYKALIDGLNEALQAAAKNIQNIVVAIMAAIAFVITNSSSKVLKSWWSMASEMTTGQQKLKAEMIKTEAQRLAAEKTFTDARIAYENSVGNAKDAAYSKALIAQKKYHLAIETADKANLAYTAATTSKKVGIVTRGFNTLKIGAAKLVLTLKSLWSSFAPAIIVSAIVAVLGFFRNIYSEAKRIKNIFSEYKKEVKNLGSTQEVKLLQTQLAIMNDKTKSQIEINAAQSALQKMLGNEKLTQDEINKKVAKRIELLKEAARADFYAHKYIETEEKIRNTASKFGFSEEELSDLVEYQYSDNKEDKQKFSSLYNKIAKQGNVLTSMWNANKLINAINETREDYRILEDVKKRLELSQNNANLLTTTTNTGNDPDEAVLRKAEKRLEAWRKLDEEDRKRQIDKQKFDLDLQQKSIDLIEDSFEKRTRQTVLNLEKEKLEIEQLQNDLFKKQQEHLKIKYESKHGTNKGFGEYYKNLTSEDLQNILPEGLRPSDIADKVSQLTDAAQSAQNKGLNAINKDLSNFLKKERLHFASQLDQQIMDIESNYEERLKLAKGNAEAIELIRSNQAKETEEAILQSLHRQLEHELEYNQKVKELLSPDYLFESDKIRDAITQEIKDQTLILENLSKRVLNDPQNEELARWLENTRIQLKYLNQELRRTKIEKLKEIFSGAAETFSSLRSSLEDFGLAFSDDINKTLDGFGQILESLASIDITRPVSAITGGIKALGGIAKLVSGIFGSADYSGYNKLKEKYDSLLDLWDELINKKKDYLSVSSADEVNRAEREALELQQKSIEAYRILGRERLNSGAGTGSHSIGVRMREDMISGESWEQAKKALEADFYKLGIGEGRMTGLFDLTAEQLEKLKTEAPTFWAQMDGDVKNYLESIITSTKELENISKLAKETLTGVSFENLQDSFLNTLADMDSDAQDFAEDFSSYLQKAILTAMLKKSYSDRLENWYTSFADANREDGISNSEFDNLQQEWNNIVNDALSERDKLKDLFDWDSSGSTSQTASSGGFQSMDQDTGNRLDGRFAALQMSGLRMEGFLSTLTISNNNIFNMTLSMNGELQKHTQLFSEIRELQKNSYYRMEDTLKSLEGISGVLDKINNNTKGL